MSETPSIQRAMAGVMASVRGVTKSDRNTQQGFSFRGIDAILNAVGPALRAHGVFLAPHVREHTSEIVEVGQKKTPMRSVTITVSYVFHGPAGDSVEAVVIGEAMDSGDKAFSKAMSVALRTVLIQVFALPTDDKDPDEDAYERAPRGGQPGGNGHTPAARREAPTPGSHEANQRTANSGAERLLDADSAALAETLVGQIAEFGVGDVSVSAVLTQDDRATLDVTGNVTLDDLAALVLAYWAKYKHGPRQDPRAADDGAREAAAVNA